MVLTFALTVSPTLNSLNGFPEGDFFLRDLRAGRSELWGDHSKANVSETTWLIWVSARALSMYWFM